jgi:hypothetical protein
MEKQFNIAYTKGQIAGLLLAGSLSGLLSYLCAHYILILFLTGLLFIPGGIFGAVIALFQQKILGYNYSFNSVVAFIGISLSAYWIAAQIFWNVFYVNNQNIGIGQIGVFFICSFVGSFIFLLGYSRKTFLSLPSFIMLTLWGVILSLAFIPAWSSLDNASTDFTFPVACGFIIWQGGMALGLGLVTLKKMQNVFIAGIIILVLGLIVIAALRIDKVTKLIDNNDYQQEVNELVSPDFMLVSSSMDLVYMLG